MKLPFEEWIQQKRLSVNASKLFTESTNCYRNSAYRASLLFSYLGLFTIIKEVIINSNKPTAITPSRWNSIISKLQNDDLWEKTVYEELTNSSTPIFNINEDLRQQIKYWKDRRNDSAHFKNNDIESHHTESLWSFIKSNLSKINIEGGKENLLNKFQRHFDPTFTPANSDFSHLIVEINNSVETITLTEFWQELFERIDQYWYLGNHWLTISDLVFKLCNDNVRESLRDFLKEIKYDLTMIFNHPENISYFNYSESDVREIWRTRIIAKKEIAFSVYGTLLRNNLIPAAQVDEANQHMLLKLTDNKPQDEATHTALMNNGFGELIFREVILDDRLKNYFTYVNPRADMIAYYIEKYPLRKETVEVVCEMYTRAKYSFWLAERLVKIFSDLPDKKLEFHTIANNNNYTIPEELK